MSFSYYALTFVGLTIMASPISAKETTIVCERGNYHRTIELKEGRPGLPHHCQVHYQKGDIFQNRKLKLWEADYTPNYCKDLVEDLVAKLEKWEWHCKKNNTAAPANKKKS